MGSGKSASGGKGFERGDERILGNGGFLESVLKSAEDNLKKKYEL
jgi:hypothetical protein